MVKQIVQVGRTAVRACRVAADGVAMAFGVVPVSGLGLADQAAPPPRGDQAALTDAMIDHGPQDTAEGAAVGRPIGHRPISVNYATMMPSVDGIFDVSGNPMGHGSDTPF